VAKEVGTWLRTVILKGFFRSLKFQLTPTRPTVTAMVIAFKGSSQFMSVIELYRYSEIVNVRDFVPSFLLSPLLSSLLSSLLLSPIPISYLLYPISSAPLSPLFSPFSSLLSSHLFLQYFPSLLFFRYSQI
jgi:hypothetical protein